jgi:hypothetical protein
MSKIAFEAGEPQEETVSAFLMLVLEYATEIGLFSLLERLLHVTMKTVSLATIFFQVEGLFGHRNLPGRWSR